MVSNPCLNVKENSLQALANFWGDNQNFIKVVVESKAIDEMVCFTSQSKLNRDIVDQITFLMIYLVRFK